MADLDSTYILISLMNIKVKSAIVQCIVLKPFSLKSLFSI